MTEPTPEPSQQGPNYVGIGGLLALMTALMAISTVYDLTHVPVAFDGANPAGARALAVGFGLLGLYGGFCCLMLLARSPTAPTHAWTWWALSLAAVVGDSLYSWLVAGTQRPLPLAAIALCAVWLAYLPNSERVRATYGASPGLTRPNRPPSSSP